MSSPFLAGVIAGYGVAVPVGTIAVLIAGLAARTSLSVGVAAGLGAATADGVYALLAVLGGAVLAELIAPFATPLRWTAAITLLALAAYTAWSAWRGRNREPEMGSRGRPVAAAPLRAYAGILGLTLLNPATVVYFSALVLGRGGAGGGLWFVAGAFLASASWQTLVAASGALAGRLLTGPRGQFITALVSSGVIAVLAILLLR